MTSEILAGSGYIRSLFKHKGKVRASCAVDKALSENDSSYPKSLLSALIELAQTGRKNEAEHCVTYTYELKGEPDLGVPSLHLTLNKPKEGDAAASYSFLLVEEEFLSSGNLGEVFSCTWADDGKPCVEYACGSWEDRVFNALEEGKGPEDRAAFIANLASYQACGL